MKNEKMINRIDLHLGGLLSELNNEIRIERMYGLENHAPKTEATVLVSCCGCNEEVRITREAADEWTDTDFFMCHECE